MKATLITLLILIVLSAIIFAPRIYKDVKKKRNYANTYAIQNVGTGKDIRVHNAGNDEGTKIILYNHNLYTQKTFEPSATPVPGVNLWQQTLGGSHFQYWEFIKQPNETYLIRLKDSELYLTITSDENNSDIILMPKQDSDNQRWKLIRQNPII